MHADLAGEQPEGIFAVHAERGRLNASFLAGLVVVQDRLKSLAFGPAQIHAHKHLGPILRFGSARARMNGHDRITRIVLARKQSFSFEAIDALAKSIDLTAKIGFYVLALAR